jgi:hypothetical protein
MPLAELENTNTEEMQLHINSPNWIQTHDFSVQPVENSTHLRPYRHAEIGGWLFLLFTIPRNEEL